jgi:hypothetical protein
VASILGVPSLLNVFGLNVYSGPERPGVLTKSLQREAENGQERPVDRLSKSRHLNRIIMAKCDIQAKIIIHD